MMSNDRKDTRWVPSDEWLVEKLRESVPKATEEDRTEECVDEAFLERFLDANKPALSDPFTMHVLGCPYCMRRAMLARKAHEQQQGKKRQSYSRGISDWLIGRFKR